MPELIWDGKYDKDGRRVAPPRIALPFQTVETVNESAQERQHTFDLFSSGRDLEWRNRLIWGDKKYVLPSLLDELAGKADLIYIDPPFATGADFSFPVTLDDGEFTKIPSVIEQKAYRDTWGRGWDGYLEWFYEALCHLSSLLSDTGSIYVHLDYHVGHYVKCVLDEVLGRENLVNELVWRRTYAHNDPGRYGVTFDSLYFYEKSKGKHIWNQLYEPYDLSYVDSHFSKVDAQGRRYQLVTLDAPGHGRPPNYLWNGIAPPRGRIWTLTKGKMEELEQRDGIEYTRNGVPRRKYYLDELPGVPVQALWTDIPPVNSQALESVGYPTQKPERLLERIIAASSNEGGIVVDCFAGSGTTAAVAEKLNRRWIAADLGRFAIHTTRKRLLSISNVRPFVVQNLGKYERQAWQVSEFGEGAELRYRRFILDLYKAQPLSGYVWLHGIRGGTFIHVGSVDAPVTVGDVKQIVLEHRRAIGTGAGAPTTSRIDLLGWDFAFELNEVAKQQAALANVDFHFVRIPREVLEKRAVEQGDIAFYELAALAVDVLQKERTVTLQLTDFVIPLDDVPEDVQRAVTHWTQWIDYWAVDWDNNDDTFHNQWQTYRTRKDPSLQKSAAHSYEEPGCYTVVVKVIDILGNDTTKTLTVEVS